MEDSKQLTPRKKAVIIALCEEGVPSSHIAKRLHFHKSAVSRFVKKYEETGEVVRKEGSDRPRVSTERQDKVLERLSLKDRFESAPFLNQKWKRATKVKATPRTVNR